MSEENVAVVGRAFDAYTRGDIDRSPAAVRRRHPHHAGAGVLADPGDYVVVTTRQSGRGKQSGVEVEAEFTFVFAIRDEQIAEWRIFVRENEGLAAAGVGG
jgi:ketosteroid isomerase-like protein